MSDSSGWGPSGPYAGPPGHWGWTPPPPPPKPGVIPLAPLGVDTVFGGAFATMRRYAGPLFGLAALVYVALGALLAGAGAVAYLSVRDHLDALYSTSVDARWSDVRPILLAFGTVWALALLGALVAGALVQASCAATLHDAVLGRRTTLRQVWRRSWPRTPSVLGVTLLLGLVMLIPMALFGALFLSLVLAMVSGVLLPFGILFLLAMVTVPLTIWLYVLFGFAPAAAVLESARPVQALRRSVRLVKGAWWRTFGILLLGGATVLVVSLAIGLPLTFATPRPQPYDMSNPPTTDMADAFTQGLHQMGGYMVLSMAGNLLTQMFATVFLPLIATLLYIDRRIRSEGLADVLLRAAGLPQE
jgi:hypothetical protein